MNQPLVFDFLRISYFGVPSCSERLNLSCVSQLSQAMNLSPKVINHFPIISFFWNFKKKKKDPQHLVSKFPKSSLLWFHEIIKPWISPKRHQPLACAFSPGPLFWFLEIPQQMDKIAYIVSRSSANCATIAVNRGTIPILTQYSWYQ